jgi:hypothetical protein
VVPTHPQTEIIKFLFVPFDKVVKLVRLAGVNGLDQFKIFIFDLFVIWVLFRCHSRLSPDKNLSVRWIFQVSAGCRPGAKTRRRQSRARLIGLSSVISFKAASQPDQVSRRGGLSNMICGYGATSLFLYAVIEQLSTVF